MIKMIRMIFMRRTFVLCGSFLASHSSTGEALLSRAKLTEGRYCAMTTISAINKFEIMFKYPFRG